MNQNTATQRARSGKSPPRRWAYLFRRVAKGPANPNEASAFEEATIGDQGKSVVRVIAFSAGGVDNVFEFGMVHAFLVSEAARPHIVSGISSGAAVAGMLADVLQAGDREPDPATRRLAQVVRFRAFLEQIQNLPKDFSEASLPDFTEVSARAGLVPLNLPTQLPLEKEERHKTALARYGLTRLINGLLSSRIKFRELTRIIRLILELQSLGELRWKWGRRNLPRLLAAMTERFIIAWASAWTGLRLWLRSLRPVVRDAPLLVLCASAPIREAIVRTEFRRKAVEKLGFPRLRDAKTILFEPWYIQTVRWLLFVISYPLVALAWMVAPPAVSIWLILNRLAIPNSIGRMRSLAVRFAGLVILVATVITLARKHHMIWRSLVEFIQLFAESDWPNFPWPWHNASQWRHGASRTFWCAFAWFAPGIVSASVAMILGSTFNKGELLALFLDGFGIKKDLLTTGVLHKLLMRAFDPSYYGKRNFQEALNEALGAKAQTLHPVQETVRNEQQSAVTGGNGQSKRALGDWIWDKQDANNHRRPKQNPIVVAPVAADVATGELVVLEPPTPIVDALSAACAITPLFAAMNVDVASASGTDNPRRWLIDGACVAREPIQPVLDLIKQLYLNQLFPQSPAKPPQTLTGLAKFIRPILTRFGSHFKLVPAVCSTPFYAVKLIKEPSLIDLCIVSPLPTCRLREQERRQMAADMSTDSVVSANAKPRNPNLRNPGTLYRLSDILALRATHSAKDERILVTLYNAVLKEYQEKTGKALFCSSSEQERSDKIKDWHLRANLRELEPKDPVHLGRSLARSSDDSAKRSLMLKTIADGCRISLKGLFRGKLTILHDEMEKHAKKEVSKGKIKKSEESTVWNMLPCRRLQDRLISEDPTKAKQPLPGVLGRESPPGITEICKECEFFLNPKKQWQEIKEDIDQANANPSLDISDWGETVKGTHPLAVTTYLPKVEPSENWPRDRTQPDGAPIRIDKERPVVSVVFSGGVFRGVFQVGVLNAFCMAGVKPDLVAGASVGTIMAALSARVFSEEEEHRRNHRIAAVAATFIAIDRLVLTDRFADFIRRLTLRAGSADFSLRDADHFFRRFDRRSWMLFSRRSRQVLGGIHRLMYLNPLELLDLLSLYAPQKRRKLADRIVLYAQDMLNRAGIGSELLGAEPLEQLINAHVLANAQVQGADFGEFLDKHGIHFMATSTNLTTSELDVLGSFCNRLRRPALVPGLLASSAFPGVFRPRMNWELRAGAPGLPEELVDGGIADNLPIIPVYRFLTLAGHIRPTPWLTLRPQVKSKSDPSKTKPCPHLLLTASLEPKKETLEGKVRERKLERIAECWLPLKTRASQLQYNVKVDAHRQTQADIRKIHEALKKQHLSPGFELPDLHVSCVKPEWLCGTFAFHPMLGFKRIRQAQSIAHGCATALAHLYCEQEDHSAREWPEHWWKPFELRDRDVCTRAREEGSEISFILKPKPIDAQGSCCFVEGKKCPFSRAYLQQVESDLVRGKASDLEPLKEDTISALDKIYQECGKLRTHRRPVE